MRAFLIIVFFMTFIYSENQYAGGSHSKARIIDFYFDDLNRARVKIKWVRESGLAIENEPSQFVFDYHNWPFRSYMWLLRYFPWVESFEKTYPRIHFQECISLLKKHFESREEVNVGQMGSVEFQKLDDGITGIIPYAELHENNGDKACYIYASRI